MGAWISSVTRSWSFPLGRIGDVHVRVHLSYIMLLAYVWSMDWNVLGDRVWGRGIEFVAIVFASVVAHELAHALASRGSDLPQRMLVLTPIGGVTMMDDGSGQIRDPLSQPLVAFAGPAANFALAAIGVSVIRQNFPGMHIVAFPYAGSANLIRSFVWVNIFVGAINLLPAYPLDAGRILRAHFGRTMHPMRATKRAVGIAQLFATAFILTGFSGIWNYWLMIGGLLLFLSAQLEERSVVFQSVLESLRLEEVMLKDFSVLSPADTLEDALAKAVHTLQDDFPVIRGTDMIGVVSRQSIINALRAEGNGYVQTVMERVFQVAQKGESLASGLRKLATHNLSIIPVVDDGRLIGIVTFQNLMHSMRLLAESRRLKRTAEKEL
jgi:Zn-dependent protease/predicted transcriptional regulator